MFFCKFRKLISGILIGFGIATLMVLFLPPVGLGIKFLLGK